VILVAAVMSSRRPAACRTAETALTWCCDGEVVTDSVSLNSVTVQVVLVLLLVLQVLEPWFCKVMLLIVLNVLVVIVVLVLVPYW
jgi:hypothetical protein